MPELGLCADLPASDFFEYGQAGVGSCLASPSDLVLRPDPTDPDNHYLLVVNSNSRSNFSGSSLLSINASSVDLSCPSQGLHELQTNALGTEEFLGRIGVDEEQHLGLIGQRQAGGYEGDLTDAIHVVDLSDPAALAFSDRAPRSWGPYRFVQVPADPWSIQVNPQDGKAYVLGMTTHEVHAIDLLGETLSFVDLRGERSVGDPVFDDADFSGSAPDLEIIAVNEDLLQNEDLSLEYFTGTTRFYTLQEAGDSSTALVQWDSGDGVDFHLLSGGPLLRAGGWMQEDLLAAAVVPTGEALEAVVAGLSAETGLSAFGRAHTTGSVTEWSLDSDPILSPVVGSWDEEGLHSPDWLAAEGVSHLYFSGGPAPGTAIGHAQGSSLTSLGRVGDGALSLGEGVVLAASSDGFDSAAVFGPSVVRDPSTGQFFLWYTGHASSPVADAPPSDLRIGLARSDNGLAFERILGEEGGAVLSPGEAGSWDAEGVAMPSVFHDNGRFQMWYQGFDGSRWRTGRATSIDGRTWEKDPRNPVTDTGASSALWPPPRVYAMKASPGGYYRVEGEVSGALANFVFEGQSFEVSASPLWLQVVGGQALGKGPTGEPDASGVSAPSAVGDDLVLVQAHSGSVRSLYTAEDLGAGLKRTSPLYLSGFSGSLSGLNGLQPSLQPLRPELRRDAGGQDWLVFETEGGLALAGGELYLSKRALELEARGGGIPILERGEAGDFDDEGVLSPSLVLEGPDGVLRLYYEGFNGTSSQIGLAVSTDGETWTRVSSEPVFGRGAAGGWDDASVGSPTVIWDAVSQTFHMWYVGSDGSQSRVGYAESSDGLSWSRSVDANGVGQWVLDGDGLSFAGDGLADPSVRATADGLEMWFAGALNGTYRVGRARSEDGVNWSPVLNPTTAGDRFVIRTERGDEDESSGIFLGDDRDHPRIVDGFIVHGAGVSGMTLSPDGRFALIANKRSPFIVILDLWDDSTDEQRDANYYDIEAVLRIPQSHGMVGTRDLVFAPDGQTLWATLSPLVRPGIDDPTAYGTEGLVRIDWSQIQDEPHSRVFNDGLITGYLPAGRGIEEDEGYFTEVSVGPSSLLLNQNGDRGYVTNFNENALYIFDLEEGARGSTRAIIDGLDENPWKVVLSPDERLAYVINNYGISRGGAQHSTLQVIDVDEDSPRFGEILTTLSNLGSREDSACD